MIGRRHLFGLFFVVVVGTAMPALAQQLDGPTRARAQAVIQICRNDATTLCPGIRPGGGRILTCLQEKASVASAACRAALPDAEALRAAKRDR